VITNYERGRNNPTAAKLPDIAKALEVPLEALYGIEAERMPEEKKGAGTRREAEIQKIFRELPPAKQRAVLEHAKGLRKAKSH
jgi:transcriptional regulator with XRE-family HTH domain